MTIPIVCSLLTLGSFTTVSWQRQGMEEAVLPMTQTRSGGLGIGYAESEQAEKYNFAALVRAIGETEVIAFRDPEGRRSWYARQEFAILDSPDGRETSVTGYYVVGPELESLTKPKQPLKLDEGKYLLFGRRQPTDSIQFDWPSDGLDSDKITLESSQGTNVTVSGLFAVDAVRWGESTPRWRFLQDTVAASMAHARGDAIADMAYLIVRLRNTTPPRLPGENLGTRTGKNLDTGERPEAQGERLTRIIRDSALDPLVAQDARKAFYLSSVVAHLADDRMFYDGQRPLIAREKIALEKGKAFLDAAHRFVVQERHPVPSTFQWPIMVRGAAVPKGYQTKLLEIAENAQEPMTVWFGTFYISKLDTPDLQKRFFSLTDKLSPEFRVKAYEKLIAWRGLDGVTVTTQKEPRRTLKILDEESIRQKIAASF